MKKAYLIIGIIAVLLAILIGGCATQTSDGQLIGGQKDEHGCLIAAGYSWCEPKQKCLGTWEEPCEDSIACTADAKICPDGSAVGRVGPNCEFAPCPGEESGEQCAKEGQYAAQNACCEGLDEFDTQTGMGSLCYDASKGTPVCKAIGTRSEGWYYTSPQTLLRYDKCSAAEDELCGAMPYSEAQQIAKASECGDNLKTGCTCPEGYRKDGDACNPECYYSTPKCLAPSIECEKSHFCNEGTGTWWINLNLQKEGCAPACVINVDTKAAEINWRCTGLVAQ